MQAALQQGNFPINRVGVAAVVLGTGALTMASLALLFMSDHPSISIGALTRRVLGKPTPGQPVADAVATEPRQIPVPGQGASSDNPDVSQA